MTIHAATLSTIRQQIARIPAGPGRSADEYVEDLRRTLDCMEVAETLEEDDIPLSECDNATDEQIYFDALKRISKYMTPKQISRDNIGLQYMEYLEKAYENAIEEAKRVTFRKRRPLDMPEKKV